MSQSNLTATKAIGKTQLLFLLLVTFWAFLPGRLIPWLEVGSLRINWNELLLVGGSVCAVALTAWKRFKNGSQFPIALALLLAYAGVSLSWSGTRGLDAAGMSWTIVTSTAAPVLAFCFIYTDDPEICKKRLWALSVCVFLISSVYLAESFFDLGLRSEVATDFGLQRLRGPLYNATMGQFILFPCLGYSVDRLISRHSSKWLAISMILILTVCVLALGSRSALLSLLLFALVALMKLRAKAKIVFLAVSPLVLLISGVFVFSRANSERLTSMEDLSRAATYYTALNMITQGTSSTQVFGYGYGGQWPWYVADTTPGLVEDENMTNTPFGLSLYHPHSTVLLVVVELGAVGLFLGAGVVFWLYKSIRINIRAKRLVFLGIGLTASSLICFFDLAIFKSPLVNTIWWAYAFGASTMCRAVRTSFITVSRKTRKAHYVPALSVSRRANDNQVFGCH